jgi:hypothetical protein
VNATAAIAWDRKMFVSAPMANIIARIAGRPAKSAWPISMTNEPVRVVFHLDQDLRLIGVLCGAVQFQALHAGLEPDAGDLLAKATEDVCRATLSEFPGDSENLDVTVDTFADRIEIAIHNRGQSIPAVGLEMFAPFDASGGGMGGVNGLELLSRVDRVLYNTEDGVARTTLVKFFPAHH